MRQTVSTVVNRPLRSATAFAQARGAFVTMLAHKTLLAVMIIIAVALAKTQGVFSVIKVHPTVLQDSTQAARRLHTLSTVVVRVG